MRSVPAADRLPDEDLVQQVAAGDREAFAELYHRRRPDVFRFALHMTADASVAEDVVQDAFMAVIEDASRFDRRRAAAVAWLCGIARNHLRRRLARDRRLEPLAHDEEGLDWAAAPPRALADLLRVERVDALRRAVLSLPLRYREAIVLCDLQELSYADAAAALSCAVGTVRSRLHRGRVLLGVEAVGGHANQGPVGGRRGRGTGRRGGVRACTRRSSVMKWEHELGEALRELARTADDVPANPETEQRLLAAFDARAHVERPAHGSWKWWLAAAASVAVVDGGRVGRAPAATAWHGSRRAEAGDARGCRRTGTGVRGGRHRSGPGTSGSRSTGCDGRHARPADTRRASGGRRHAAQGGRRGKRVRDAAWGGHASTFRERNDRAGGAPRFEPARLRFSNCAGRSADAGAG